MMHLQTCATSSSAKEAAERRLFRSYATPSVCTVPQWIIYKAFLEVTSLDGSRRSRKLSDGAEFPLSKGGRHDRLCKPRLYLLRRRWNREEDRTLLPLARSQLTLPTQIRVTRAGVRDLPRLQGRL